jgi:Mor family transcriptional regulator
MARNGSTRSAELVMRLVEIGTRTLVEQLGEALGLTDLQAREAMREVAHSLAVEYGGTYLYVPQDREFELTKRDMQIYARLQGGNANDLAVEFGLSVAQIYSINRHVRDQLLREKQGRLPGFDDAKE